MYTLAQLAETLGCELTGDGSKAISGLSTLAQAKQGELTFLANAKYQSQLADTKASAVIISPDLASLVSAPTACLINTDPYLTFAKSTALFDTAPSPAAGIHPSAVVAASASVDPSASIAANAVIDADAVIEANAIIGANSVVGAGSKVGEGSELKANVTLYHDVKIGKHCILHSGSVIGADGFGFAPSKEGWQKIHQLGGVTIEDRVEVGAGTTIDRGALVDTFIGSGVIIDNQVQIAHNVSIGKNTAIAGCTAIAGSTEVGANCTIAGAVGIVGHIKISDNVHITAMTLVTHSINEPGAYSSGTQMQNLKQWRRNAVRFGQLDSLSKRVSKLEKHAEK